MKKIELTQGKFTLVDDGDFEWLSQHKWCAVKNYNTYYANRSEWNKNNKKYKTVYIHREIMEKKQARRLKPFEDIDHINRDGLDNRECNLRLCNPSKNGGNSRKQKYYAGKITSSKYKGVSWKKRTKKWRAYIRANGKLIHLGYFINEKIAAKAYDKAAKELFGKFARLNFEE